MATIIQAPAAFTTKELNPGSGWPLTIRAAGLCFFAVSFIVSPGIHEHRLFAGFTTFVEVPKLASGLLIDGHGRDFLFGVCGLAAWAANFTVVFKPKAVALFGLVAAWVGYLVFFSILVAYLPVYPWLIGISLINLSRFGARNPIRLAAVSKPAA